KKAALEFMNGGAKWSKVPAGLQAAFVGRVFHSNPQLLIADSHHYIGAYLTQAAFDKFTKSHKGTLITESEGSSFKIEDWHLELVDVDSQDVHTSYLDREIRLVIKSFSLAKDNSTKNFVENLHRDNDVKLHISNYGF
ncbi:MAG: hypothetical protein AAB968_02810, partial [Patescibacteria group bacterium]